MVPADDPSRFESQPDGPADDPPQWLRVVPPPHPARMPVERLLRQCRQTQTRRSGPGGQHRNKTSTAMVLEHEPTGVIAEASERRSQAENRRQAVERLRMTLAIVVRCQESVADDETLRQRRGGGALRVAAGHLDRAAVFALLLDDAFRRRGDLQAVGQEWRTSASQILRLMRSETPALDYLNRLRRHFDLRPLR